ncbi:hypothetical protein [Nostoc sp.]
MNNGSKDLEATSAFARASVGLLLILVSAEQLFIISQIRQES